MKKQRGHFKSQGKKNPFKIKIKNRATSIQSPGQEKHDICTQIPDKVDIY